MSITSIVSFVLFTAFVAVGTYLIVRKREHMSQDGFFLAGRSLTFPFIAGSLLLTNLSTEQLVGLNGSAFKEGLSVMAWEVVAVIALVLMALLFLPKFLKAGVTTVPEYLARRFDRGTELTCNIIFLIAYTVILLPIILYTGARGMMGVMDIQLGVSEMTELYIIVFAVALIGSIYAIWGGLNSCAVSDTLNGIGLLIGGLIISYYALTELGDGELGNGVCELLKEEKRMNSIGGHDAEAPFAALFTGILFINVFYWCTNQQIIQRTLGAKSLAEGQKGVLLTGALKLFGPLYLVIPGIIAAILFARGELMIEDGMSDKAYGALVNAVLPPALTGFFAAVLLGAILSSFNSALNSTCTLFSLGIYKPYIRQNASDKEVVNAGRIFGTVLTVGSIIIAPLLAHTGSIFNYLQSMNAIYFIPILAVVVVGMMTKYVPGFAANIALIGGVLLIALGYFVHPFTQLTEMMGQYHFVGAIFVLIVVWMLLAGILYPRQNPYSDYDAKVLDMTPWKYTKGAAVALVLIVIAIYAVFADFSVL